MPLLLAHRLMLESQTHCRTCCGCSSSLWKPSGDVALGPLLEEVFSGVVNHPLQQCTSASICNESTLGHTIFEDSSSGCGASLELGPYSSHACTCGLCQCVRTGFVNVCMRALSMCVCGLCQCVQANLVVVFHMKCTTLLSGKATQA